MQFSEDQPTDILNRIKHLEQVMVGQGQIVYQGQQMEQENQWKEQTRRLTTKGEEDVNIVASGSMGKNLSKKISNKPILLKGKTNEMQASGKTQDSTLPRNKEPEATEAESITKSAGREQLVKLIDDRCDRKQAGMKEPQAQYMTTNSDHRMGYEQPGQRRMTSKGLEERRAKYQGEALQEQPSQEKGSQRESFLEDYQSLKEANNKVKGKRGTGKGAVRRDYKTGKVERMG